VGVRVAAMVPVTVTVLGMSLKAVAATFAASVVVSGAALVAVQELTDNEPPRHATPAVERQAPVAPRTQPTSLDPQPREPSAPVEPEAELPTERFETLPNAVPSAGARQSTDAPLPSAAPLKDRLAREAALLERARASLGASPASALQAVREHARDFPDGQLRAERMFIEAQALKNLGRHAEARHKAERALAQYPKGLYAERVQRFLQELP